MPTFMLNTAYWSVTQSLMATEYNIHEYTDYRTFLRSYSQDMKQKKVTWSYGAFAQALKLKTTSSITKIVQGQRDAGPEITEKMISFFGFNEKQAQYFRDLVRLEKIKKDPRLSLILMEKMGKEHPDGSLKIMDDKSFLVISNWYYLALRELCRMKKFKEEPQWIANLFQFKVTARDISHAIRTLLDIGLLKRKSNGRLYVDHGRLNTTNDIASEAIKRYHEQMLENATVAIRKFSVDEREITSTSLLMSSKNIDVAKELIRDFKKKFERLMEEDSGDQVFQLQIQLFPLTKKVDQRTANEV